MKENSYFQVKSLKMARERREKGVFVTGSYWYKEEVRGA